MPPRTPRVRIHPEGPEYDAEEVQMIESVERWSELRLDDGTVLKIKPVVTSILRVPGQYDPEGNPICVVKGAST